MKKRVRLGLSRMTAESKIEKGRQIVAAMTGNSNFASPVPALTAVTTAINNLETAWTAAQDGGRTKKLILADMEDAFDLILERLALYVEATAAGNETIISSAGMEARRDKQPVNEIAVPQNLRVTRGSSGELKLLWDKVKGASSYIVEMSLESAQDTRQTLQWQQAAITTKAAAVITGLTPMSRYNFRVAAVGAAGKTASSGMVSEIVL